MAGTPHSGNPEDDLLRLRERLEEELRALPPDSQGLVSAYCVSATIRAYAQSTGAAVPEAIPDAIRALSEQFGTDLLDVILDESRSVSHLTTDAVNREIQKKLQQVGDVPPVRALLQALGTFQIARDIWKRPRHGDWARLVEEIARYPQLLVSNPTEDILTQLDPSKSTPRTRARLVNELMNAQFNAAALTQIGGPVRVYVSSGSMASQTEREALARALRDANPLVPWDFEYTPRGDRASESSYSSDQIKECDLFALLISGPVSDAVTDECQAALQSRRPILTFVLKGMRTPEVSSLLRPLRQGGSYRHIVYSTPGDLTAVFTSNLLSALRKGYRAHELAVKAGYIPPPDAASLTRIYTGAMVSQQPFRSGEDLVRSLFAESLEQHLEVYEPPNFEGRRDRWIYSNPIEALQHYPGMAIWGTPGAGKTTLLQHLALRTAADTQVGDQGPMPLRFSLKHYRPDRSLQAYFKEQLGEPDWSISRRHRLPIDSNWIAGNLDVLGQAGKVLFLIDGLDDIVSLAPAEQTKAVSQIRSFTNQALSSGCTVVFFPDTEAASKLGEQIGLAKARLHQQQPHLIALPRTEVGQRIEGRKFRSHEMRPDLTEWLHISDLHLLHIAAHGQFDSMIPSADRSGRALEALGDSPLAEPLARAIQGLQEEQQRYVNVCLADRNGYGPLPKTISLAADHDYDLRVDIGALSLDSVIENAKKYAFPADLLPQTEVGHWLDVVATSDDFLIEKARHALFLPRLGPSWTCACPPGAAHQCDKSERQPYLIIPVRSPKELGPARIRVGIYYQNNLIQSLLLTAEVLPSEDKGAGYNAWIDYTLTNKLNDISVFSPRALNILTNRNADGTHRIVINSNEEAMAFRLTEGQISKAIGAARETLKSIHGDGEYNSYDKNNSKPKRQFIEDLKALAQCGSILLTGLVENDADRLRMLKESLREPGNIQISRAGHTEFVFPWALLYDIPISLGASNYVICPSVDEWVESKTGINATTDRCPYNHKENTICPFGFWGFKHVVEQPPSLPSQGELPVVIQATNQPPRLLMGLNRALNRRLVEKHLETLTRLDLLSLSQCDTLPTLLERLRDAELEVLYFYCHGKRVTLEPSGLSLPALEIGNGERIYPSDITQWAAGDKWPSDHWRHTAPLVFINGCRTAELTPEMLVNFVDAFAGAHAAGVIGTEIPVHQQVANEAAEVFFSHFQRETNVGKALQQMRFQLLRKGNLIGLAYTPYCSADLRLSSRTRNVMAWLENLPPDALGQ